MLIYHRVKQPVHSHKQNSFLVPITKPEISITTVSVTETSNISTVATHSRNAVETLDTS